MKNCYCGEYGFPHRPGGGSCDFPSFVYEQEDSPCTSCYYYKEYTDISISWECEADSAKKCPYFN